MCQGFFVHIDQSVICKSSMLKFLLLYLILHNSVDGFTICIVGAGVGGLATASRIASSPDLPNDAKLIILEKNSASNVGGRCGSFSVYVENFGEFRHERGPSLLLLKDVYEDLFRDCGENIRDFNLNMVQCVPAYQVIFEDGDVINIGFPENHLESETLRQISRMKMNDFEVDGAEKWDQYMATTESFLNCGLPNFIEERLDLSSLPSFLHEATKENFRSWPLLPHSKVLDATFASSKMRALASFQDLYVGLEPFENKANIFGGVITKTAPAVFGLLSALELHPTNKKGGVFAPIGGFQAVSSSFERLAQSFGVEIRYDCTVTRISEEGVWYESISSTEGQNFLPSDLVIVNGDLPYATTTLLAEVGLAGPKAPKYDWDDRYDYSSGVIAFHWSLDKKFNQLNTHNVFLIGESNEQAERSWNTIRLNDPQVPSFTDSEYPFNFYVHRPTALDSSAAPKGCDTIMVLVPCCTLKRNEVLACLERSETIRGYEQQFDEAFISKVRDAVINRLSRLSGVGDIRTHILDEVVDTPATYGDRYNLAAGTPFGLSHGFGQLSLTRPAHEADQKNVLFVGASTKPGNGVPLVLLGAKQVASKAIEKIKRKLKRNSLY